MQLRSDRRPLYIQAAEKIEALIKSERVAPGGRLFSELELAARLGVSRSTIREALRELELHARIQRIQGRGTVVAESAPILTGLTVLESLESLAARQGWVCGTQGVAIKSVPMPPELENFFGIPASTHVTYLVRIKTRDGRPFCRMETWLPDSLISPKELRSQFKHSITEVLLANTEPRLDYAVAEVDAVAADKAAAAALRVARGTPLVVLTERFCESPSRPICYCVNAFIPATIRLEVLRRPFRNSMD